MRPFKQGDIVKCVNDKSVRGLTKNEKYEVLSINNNSDELLIQDDTGDNVWWYMRRFELTSKETFKVGDIITCINNEGARDELTIGNTYKVLKVAENQIEVVDDTQETKWWFPHRFELLTLSNVCKEPKAFSKGDVITCINNKGVAHNLLIYTDYEVLDTNTLKEVYIKDETGERHWFCNTRFIPSTTNYICQRLKKDAEYIYLVLQESFKDLMDLKVGAKVTVLCKADDYQHGWACSWNKTMDEFINKRCKVVEIDEYGIQLRYNQIEYSFPYFVIGEVSYEYPEPIELNDCVVKFIEDGDIVVGKHVIPYGILPDIYEKAKYVRKEFGLE